MSVSVGQRVQSMIDHMSKGDFLHYSVYLSVCMQEIPYFRIILKSMDKNSSFPCVRNLKLIL